MPEAGGAYKCGLQSLRRTSVKRVKDKRDRTWKAPVPYQRSQTIVTAQSLEGIK